MTYNPIYPPEPVAAPPEHDERDYDQLETDDERKEWLKYNASFAEVCEWLIQTEHDVEHLRRQLRQEKAMRTGKIAA